MHKSRSLIGRPWSASLLTLILGAQAAVAPRPPSRPTPFRRPPNCRPSAPSVPTSRCSPSMAPCLPGSASAKTGASFVNFPQWGDQPSFAVGEIRDGQLHPYPDAASNQPDPHDPAKGFIGVQSVVAV